MVTAYLSQHIHSQINGRMPLADFIELAEQLPVRWVTTQHQLSQLVDELGKCERVALDSEFIKRDSYYPYLALIQLNTGKAIYLVDAPKLCLDAFWAVLADIKLMVWHACGEDLSIFYLLSGCPPLTNIFDTQIALSYLTPQLQMGYQQAVKERLGIPLAKGHSQSDWLARPLSVEQEHYAIDDVRYLPALYLSLEQSLQQAGWLDAVAEDCQLYAAELYNSQHIADDDLYLDAADFRYDAQQMAILQSVCAWREQLARATNQPRTFILKKQNLRDLVVEQPTSIKQLAHKTSIHRSVLRIYGDELIKIVKQSQALVERECPQTLVAPYRSKDKTLTKAVKIAISEHAKAIDISEGVLIRKKWLSELYELVALEQVSVNAEQQGRAGLDKLPAGLQGWRRAWVVGTLLPLLEQHKAELQQGMGLVAREP